MNIKSNLSANDIPSIASPLEETKLPRSASAQARLNGSPVSVQFAGSKKSSIKIQPTAFALAQERAAYSNYQAALIQQTKEKSSLWSSLFGSKAQKDVKKNLAVLAQFDHEDFHLDEAIKESKREFREKVKAAGGNPDIAEEVFLATAEISDLPSSLSLPHGTAAFSPKTSEPATVAGSSDKPMRHDVESTYVDNDANTPPPEKDSGSIEDSSEKKQPPRSLKEFIASIHNLSREEIISFLESLSEPEVKNFAAANMAQDLVSQFDTTSLREQLTDLCCSVSRKAQAGISLESPQAQQAIMDAFLEVPAPIENQGLRNSGVDCYLSSALQCLRNHVANLPPARQEELLTSLRARHLETLSPEQRDSPLAAFGSPLTAFLEKKFDGRNAFAAAFLRQEVHGIMERLSQSPVNPSAAAREIGDSINPVTGNSRQQCDTSEALVALMEHLETPRIMLNERDTYHATRSARVSYNEEARQSGGELIVPFGIKEESSLQEVIHSNWVADLTGDNALEDPNGSKHDIRRERALVNPPNSITISLTRFRMKPAQEGGWAQNSRGQEIIGVPKIAVDSLGRTIREKLHTPISHLTDNVTFPTRDHEGAQAEATYTPTSIICHYGGESANSGHYATYRKENEGWFLVNDAQVTPVHLDDLMADRGNITHRQFLEENAYVVNFKKVV